MEDNKDKELTEGMKSVFGFPWENGIKPYFVNEEGFEWYIDKDITEWAHKENLRGITLKNIIGFFIKKNDFIQRVLLDKNINAVIYESGSLEDIVTHIDTLKILKDYEEPQDNKPLK